MTSPIPVKSLRKVSSPRISSPRNKSPLSPITNKQRVQSRLISRDKVPPGGVDIASVHSKDNRRDNTTIHGNKLSDLSPARHVSNEQQSHSGDSSNIAPNLAMSATDIVASVNRQASPHPKASNKPPGKGKGLATDKSSRHMIH